MLKSGGINVVYEQCTRAGDGHEEGRRTLGLLFGLEKSGCLPFLPVPGRGAASLPSGVKAGVLPLRAEVGISDSRTVISGTLSIPLVDHLSPTRIGRGVWERTCLASSSRVLLLDLCGTFPIC